MEIFLDFTSNFFLISEITILKTLSFTSSTPEESMLLEIFLFYFFELQFLIILRPAIETSDSNPYNYSHLSPFHTS